MVGDFEFPKDERFTVTTVSDARKGEELVPSGLMGPVSIEIVKKNHFPTD
jgi:hypothetical protein